MEAPANAGSLFVVMNVSLFAVSLLLILLIVVVAVRQLTVLVLVGMPVRAVLPLIVRGAAVVVRYVIVVVRVGSRRMGMSGFLAFAFNVLLCHILHLSCLRRAPVNWNWPGMLTFLSRDSGCAALPNAENARQHDAIPVVILPPECVSVLPSG
jgi:hypothetical protein